MRTPDAPDRRDDTDDAEVRSAEARMRDALGKLGTKSVPGHAKPGGRHPGKGAGPGRKPRFAREGDVPVERVPAPARSPAELQRELGEARAARGQAEQALHDAQATITTLRAALGRSEQAARAARAAVEEREAAMAGLRAEMARVASERDALKAAQAAKPKARRPLPFPKSAAPEPVRWWLLPNGPRD